MTKFTGRIFSTAFLDKLAKDRIFDLAASLAYYTALSVAPLLVFTLMAMSMVGDNFQTEFIDQVEFLVGGAAADAITTIALNANKTPEIRDFAGLIGLFTLLFSAGAIFGQLRSSLNTIFEVGEVQSESAEVSFLRATLDFIKQKVFNIGMVLTFVFVSLVSLIVSSLLSLILHGTDALWGQFVNLSISLIIFTLLFSGIYYFLPQRKIHFPVALIAGIFTAFLFSVGKSLIGLYLGQSALASLYGAAGSLIVLLMWVYYSSLIIFISAEIANEMNKANS